MKIRNYPQFAKRTFYIGLERNYCLVFIGLSGALFMFNVFLSKYFEYITPLISIVLIFLVYFLSIIAFAKNNYWFDKLLLKKNLKKILGR